MMSKREKMKEGLKKIIKNICSLRFERVDKGCGKIDPILSYDLAESDRKGWCGW